MPVYVYRGNRAFIDAVEGRLSKAGYSREGEVELADFVITYCTNMTQLEDLYFGESGFVDAMKPETLAIDLSPATPNFASELNAVTTISNIGMVEAPMVVKNQVAEDAFAKSNLSCFAAGEEGMVDKAKDILDAIFGDVEVLGGAGVAQLAKAANTLQKVSEVVSAIEAQALFKASRNAVSSIELNGYQPQATSPEAYFVLQAIQGNCFDGAFTIEMLMGDLSAAIMAADDYDLIIPQAEAAFHLLELLAVIGGSQKSPAALALVYGDSNEKRCSDAGLDWSKAQSLYGEPSDEPNLEDAIFDDGHDFDDIDMFGDDDLAQFGYSSN